MGIIIDETDRGTKYRNYNKEIEQHIRGLESDKKIEYLQKILKKQKLLSEDVRRICWNIVGKEQLKLGRKKEAAESFEKQGYYEKAADIFREEGDLNEAARLYKKSVTSDKYHSSVDAGVAEKNIELAKAMGSDSKILGAYALAIKARKNHIWGEQILSNSKYYKQIADLLEKKGKHKSALAALKKSAELAEKQAGYYQNQDSAQLYRYAAETFEKVGEDKKAGEAYWSVATTLKDMGNPTRSHPGESAEGQVFEETRKINIGSVSDNYQKALEIFEKIGDKENVAKLRRRLENTKREN